MARRHLASDAIMLYFQAPHMPGVPLALSHLSDASSMSRGISRSDHRQLGLVRVDIHFPIVMSRGVE